MMATAFSTPVRQAAAAVSELSNESPLPTPPRAMHDLIRHGRLTGSQNSNNSSGKRAAASSNVAMRDDIEGRTLINEMDEAMAAYLPPLTDQLEARVQVKDDEHLSSSPSQRHRATTGSGSNAQRQFASTLGSTSASRRDSTGNTLASSLGTSIAGHRSALGSQMGIGADAATTSNILRTSNKRTTQPVREGAQKATESFVSRLQNNRTMEKENVEVVSGIRTGNGASTIQKSTDRRSPALGTKSSFERPTSSAFTRSTIRRTSAEAGNASGSHQQQAIEAHPDAEVVRRSSDEGGAASSLVSRSSASQASTDVIAGPSKADVPAQTPSMQTGSRTLRSAHTSTQRSSAAPWSVGRPMKRLDRHSGLDKPPQRVVAASLDMDDDDEEDVVQVEGSVHHGVERRVPSVIVEEANAQILGDSGDRKEQVEVPLGADEDEEEDEGGVEGSRTANRGVENGSVKTSYRTGAVQGSSQQVESAQRRRTAINDILAAKVPSEAGPRRVLASMTTEPDIGVPLAAPTFHRDPYHRDASSIAPAGAVAAESDFMSLVRREAERQRSSSFIEQVRSKPSKDLETKFNGFKFKKIRKAGEGGFSTVWIVHGPYAAPHPSLPATYVDVPEHEQAYFAMKQVTLKKMEQVSREEVLEECNLLQMLASKQNNENYILRFFGWKSSTGSLKILLELGEHDFNQILRARRLTHQQIVTYWHQMVQAVHFTHEQGNIVHTDLKPANFLMANGRLKLIDFGIAQKIPVGTIHIKRDAMIGTPNYMAPETVRAVKEGRNTRAAVVAAAAASSAPSSTDPAISRVYKAGKASDVWALGCILYQMVYGRPPFEAHHGDEKLRQILDPKHIIDFSPTRYGPPLEKRDGEEDDDDDDDGVLESVDADLLDVMRLALTYSAADRITIPSLLGHPLLKDQQRNDTANDENRDSEEQDVVPLTRDTLRDVLHKMFSFAMNGELHENNIDARADALFDNMLQRHRATSR
jgi:serine/threonine protein kinase